MIRLLAWRDTLGHGDEPDLVEPFDCDRDCYRGERPDDTRRAARACVREDLPHVAPAPTVRGLLDLAGSSYMGRPATRQPLVVLGQQFPPDYPPEPIEDGCPGAWYRSAFAASLLPYLRMRTDGGGRVDRRVFDEAPDHIQDAVELFEREQERCIAHVADERERRRRRKREIADAQRSAASRPMKARPRHG